MISISTGCPKNTPNIYLTLILNLLSFCGTPCRFDSSYLETDIISEHRSSISHAPGLVVVGLAGVHLAQEEPGLAAPLLRVNVSGDGEPGEQHLLRVTHRSLQQLLEVGVLWLIVITCCSPLSDRLPVEYEDLE